MFGKKTSKLRIHLISLRNEVITILEFKAWILQSPIINIRTLKTYVLPQLIV